MDAVVYEGLGQSGFKDIATPEPNPDEALIRVRASGICHTDIDILHGRYGNSAFPLVPGHEYAGVVVSVGSKVAGFEAGDHVVIDPNYHCGHCRACQKGFANLCETLGAYGVTANGGFAEFCTVNAANLVRVDDLGFELAALAEPVGCVLNGIQAIGTDGVDTALVFGAGPIGLLMAIALRAKGVAEIHMIDIDESRLELAETFGLGALASGSDALRVMERSVDLAVDATGVPAVAGGLTNYVANAGRVLLFGVCPPDARIEIAPFDVFRRQLTIAGAHSLNHNIPAALDVIRSAGPDMGRLISHKVPLKDIPAFLSGHGKESTLKVQAVL